MAKGGSFEREVAKVLSLWWSEGKRDDIFYRTQSSGGRFTSRRKLGKDTPLQGGDITASDPDGEPLVRNWSIEIKTGYGKKTERGINRWDVLDFLDSRQKEPILQKMWVQCKRDAELTNRVPILIFRRNGRTPCIMFEMSYFSLLGDFFNNTFSSQISITTENMYCIIFPLQNFFEWIPNIRSALCSKPYTSQISKYIRKKNSTSPME